MARFDVEDICWNKNADYYADPIGLSALLIEEMIEWGIERERMIAENFPEAHIWYFDGLIRRTETILERLGVENIPVVGDC